MSATTQSDDKYEHLKSTMTKEQLCKALTAAQRKADKRQEKIEDMAQYEVRAYSKETGAITYREYFADEEKAQAKANEQDYPDSSFNPQSAKVIELGGDE